MYVDIVGVLGVADMRYATCDIATCDMRHIVISFLMFSAHEIFRNLLFIEQKAEQTRLGIEMR